MWTRSEGANTGQKVIIAAHRRDYGALYYVLAMSASHLCANEGHFQDGVERAWVLFERNLCKRRKKSWHGVVNRTRNIGNRIGVIFFFN